MFLYFLGYKFVCPSECQLSVVIGAVVLGHNMYNNTEKFKRRSKMTYGVASHSIFVPEDHKLSKSEVVRALYTVALLNKP